MGQDEKQNSLIEYLYGEISGPEKAEFKKSLSGHPQLDRELKSYLQLRRLFLEHLPAQKAPRALTHKLLVELGVKSPWYGPLGGSWWRPALAGAFVLVLALGIGYGVKQRQEIPVPVAQSIKKPLLPRVRPTPGGQEIGDSLLANRAMVPKLKMPTRLYRPEGQFYDNHPRVSLVGYGQPLIETPTAIVPDAEIQRLEMEADHAVAQFRHQQAIRLRNMGEFKAAADILGQLVKDFPFYPFKLQAMAQRVDSLFRAGEAETAKGELRILKSLSPTMAYVLERRWSASL